MSTVSLDFSKSQPLPSQAPVTLDMSKAQPIADTRSLYEKARDNFNANTQGAKPGDGTVKGFIENIGQGGAQVIHAVAHPLDTAGGMIDALSHPIDTAHSEVRQLYADPSRFIGNAIGQAGVGTALGEAAGVAANAVGPKLLPAAGKAALLGKTPEAAYESAMKPAPSISAADRAAIVKTGLDNEIPVSKAGVEKLHSLIEDVDEKIKDTIATDPNRPIDPNAVATRADLAKAKFAKQVNAGGDLQAIDNSKQQFLQEQGAQNGQPAPPMGAADAQAMKQGTYKVLAGKYGEQGSAAVEAQKALARGLKEEIATQFPEISGLNANLGKMLDLQPVLERAVNRISNHQAIGIGTGVAGVATEAATGSLAAARVAMVLKGVLDNPNVKSRLAIAVSKANSVPISTAMKRVQDYSSSLGSASAGVGASSSGSSGQVANPQE